MSKCLTKITEACDRINREAAQRILLYVEKHGGEEADIVRWARLVIGNVRGEDV